MCRPAGVTVKELGAAASNSVP